MKTKTTRIFENIDALLDAAKQLENEKHWARKGHSMQPRVLKSMTDAILVSAAELHEELEAD
jgi:hypothetical protein